MVPIKTAGGEAKAWSIISTLEPSRIASEAGVLYDSGSGIYTLKSFGLDFSISPLEKKISCVSSAGDFFLDKLKDFFRLSVLWYLTNAKDIPLSGRLIRPIDVKGGHRFFTGTHLLPLDKIAEKYGKDRDGFIRKGREFGGEPFHYGDVSIKLLPFPRVPVYVILWLEDAEFPSRVDLLFDSTCEFHIPLSDIVWATSMMSVLSMLLEG